MNGQGLERFIFSAFTRYVSVLQHFKAKNLLGSKHYPEQIDKAIDYAAVIDGTTLIIDSGAFSVWNMGGTLDLGEYITFLKKFEKDHRSKFADVWYVNLDVIPGSKDSKSISQDEIIAAADAGFENYLKMKNEFDNVIHVFHQGEDIPVLDRLLATNPAYIGVSPSNAVMTNPRKLWLDEAYKHIPSHVKTHGFAVTSIDLMRSYDWYSVDSTSWFMIGMYGKLCIPLNKDRKVILTDDEPIYDKFDISTSIRKVNGKDGYNTLAKTQPALIKEVDKYIEFLCKKHPIKVEHIFSDRNEGRVLANIEMFIRFEQTSNFCAYQSNSLF